jgi:hypothetical protein
MPTKAISGARQLLRDLLQVGRIHLNLDEGIGLIPDLEWVGPDAELDHLVR